MAKSILIVEDEPLKHHQLRTLASGEGHEHDVTVAQNVEEAKTFLTEKRFDLVVADLAIGKVDDAGLEVLSRAKEIDQTTQVIVITHFSTVDLASQAMQMGAFDFLDRDPAGISFAAMLRAKIKLALRFRELLLKGSHVAHDGK